MEHSTENPLSGLSPEAREEVVRLTARLQAESEQDRNLLSAAREAGIEDRFLAEAADRMRSAHPDPPRSSAPILPATVLVLFVFAQCYASAGTFLGGTFHGPGTGNLWVSFFFAALLGVVLPRARSRWLAPLIVLLTWIALIAFYRLMAYSSGDPLATMGLTYASRIAALEAALALAGAYVGGLWNAAERRPRTR